MTKLERIQIRNERIKRRNEAKESSNSVSNIVPYIIAHEGPLRLEICIHCYKYQKRLCYMLSSLFQQTGDVPDIIINISHCPNDGNPTTEKVCSFFRDRGLHIIETIVTKEEVHNRGSARDKQTKASTADYLLYADCDMVYDINFMSDLYKQLNTKLSYETKIMGADRISLRDDFCIKYFEEDKKEYPCVIDSVAKLVSQWPVKWVTGKNTCAGNFQLVSLKAIKEKGIGYGGRNRDFWRNTRSDRAMRCKMGGRVPIDVKKQWHINHSRALDEQR